MNMEVFRFVLLFISLAFVKGGQDDLLQDISDPFSAGQHQINKFGQALPTRYLLYDVNPGEGFNLRRDVHLRITNMVKFMNDDDNKQANWVIVLPPWGPLYHWKTENIEQRAVPWRNFFDLDSLRRYTPVIEFTEFLKMSKKPVLIDEVIYLQRFKEGWKDGKWEHRVEVRDCIERTGFQKLDDGSWWWHFWGYDEEVTIGNFLCLSVQSEIQGFLIYMTKNTTGRTVFLNRGEQLTHGHYSEWSPEWWTARRSLRFAQHLRAAGDKFRAKYLDSNDKDDRTELDPDWTKMKRKHGDALGGPYIAVHLRRRDFLSSHRSEVPSITGAAQQIEKALLLNNLTTAYICTDAPQTEFWELKQKLSNYTIVKYLPSDAELSKYTDGGVAIIDQWIAAHARYFMGTTVSTFSFRIHEEREILGFKQESTYNSVCSDHNVGECRQPTKWDIKYP